MTIPKPTLAEAEAAFAEGQYQKCLDMISHLHAGGSLSIESARLAYDAHMRLGELGKALEQAELLRQLAPNSAHERMIRHLRGQIIETDPSWLPRIDIPTPQKRRDPPAEKRILHILKESRPYVETGFTMRSRLMLQAQQMAGYTPHVVTSLGFPRTKGIETYPSTQIVDGVCHHRIDRSDVPDPRTLPHDFYVTLNAHLAATIADEIDPLLIQAGTGFRGYETALTGIALSDRLSVPFVYEVRGFQEATWTTVPARGEQGEYYARRFAQETRCMDRADVVITIADSMAEEIVSRGISDQKVAVVPNAVDVHRFTPRPKRTDLVEKYSLADRFTVGYVSNLGAREGIADLIRAIGILRSRGVDIAGLIVGAGPQRESLEQLIVDLNLNSTITLTGHVSNREIEDFYALIDLFVVPRINDRAARLVTPLKPLEAMSMGLPIIASDLPALRELISPGERGEVFPPANAPALADAIEDLAANRRQRRRYAKAGLKWVRRHRSLESTAIRYGSILGTLIQ